MNVNPLHAAAATDNGASEHVHQPAFQCKNKKKRKKKKKNKARNGPASNTLPTGFGHLLSGIRIEAEDDHARPLANVLVFGAAVSEARARCLCAHEHVRIGLVRRTAEVHFPAVLSPPTRVDSATAVALAQSLPTPLTADEALAYQSQPIIVVHDPAHAPFGDDCGPLVARIACAAVVVLGEVAGGPVDPLIRTYFHPTTPILAALPSPLAPGTDELHFLADSPFGSSAAGLRALLADGCQPGLGLTALAAGGPTIERLLRGALCDALSSDETLCRRSNDEPCIVPAVTEALAAASASTRPGAIPAHGAPAAVAYDRAVMHHRLNASLAAARVTPAHLAATAAKLGLPATVGDFVVHTAGPHDAVTIEGGLVLCSVGGLEGGFVDLGALPTNDHSRHPGLGFVNYNNRTLENCIHHSGDLDHTFPDLGHVLLQSIRFEAGPALLPGTTFRSYTNVFQTQGIERRPLCHAPPRTILAVDCKAKCVHVLQMPPPSPFGDSGMAHAATNCLIRVEPDGRLTMTRDEILDQAGTHTSRPVPAFYAAPAAPAGEERKDGQADNNQPSDASMTLSADPRPHWALVGPALARLGVNRVIFPLAVAAAATRSSAPAKLMALELTPPETKTEAALAPARLPIPLFHPLVPWTPAQLLVVAQHLLAQTPLQATLYRVHAALTAPADEPCPTRADKGSQRAARTKALLQQVAAADDAESLDEAVRQLESYMGARGPGAGRPGAGGAPVARAAAAATGQRGAAGLAPVCVADAFAERVRALACAHAQSLRWRDARSRTECLAPPPVGFAQLRRAAAQHAAAAQAFRVGRDRACEVVARVSGARVDGLLCLLTGTVTDAATWSAQLLLAGPAAAPAPGAHPLDDLLPIMASAALGSVALLGAAGGGFDLMDEGVFAALPELAFLRLAAVRIHTRERARGAAGRHETAVSVAAAQGLLAQLERLPRHRLAGAGGAAAILVLRLLAVTASVPCVDFERMLGAGYAQGHFGNRDTAPGWWSVVGRCVRLGLVAPPLFSRIRAGIACALAAHDQGDLRAARAAAEVRSGGAAAGRGRWVALAAGLARLNTQRLGYHRNGGGQVVLTVAPAQTLRLAGIDRNSEEYLRALANAGRSMGLQMPTARIRTPRGRRRARERCPPDLCERVRRWRACVEKSAVASTAVVPVGHDLADRVARLLATAGVAFESRPAPAGEASAVVLATSCPAEALQIICPELLGTGDDDDEDEDDEEKAPEPTTSLEDAITTGGSVEARARRVATLVRPRVPDALGLLALLGPGPDAWLTALATLVVGTKGRSLPPDLVRTLASRVAQPGLVYCDVGAHCVSATSIVPCRHAGCGYPVCDACAVRVARNRLPSAGVPFAPGDLAAACPVGHPRDAECAATLRAAALELAGLELPEPRPPARVYVCAEGKGCPRNAVCWPCPPDEKVDCAAAMAGDPGALMRCPGCAAAILARQTETEVADKARLAREAGMTVIVYSNGSQGGPGRVATPPEACDAATDNLLVDAGEVDRVHCVHCRQRFRSSVDVHIHADPIVRRLRRHVGRNHARAFNAWRAASAYPLFSRYYLPMIASTNPHESAFPPTEEAAFDALFTRFDGDFELVRQAIRNRTLVLPQQ